MEPEIPNCDRDGNYTVHDEHGQYDTETACADEEVEVQIVPEPLNCQCKALLGIIKKKFDVPNETSMYYEFVHKENPAVNVTIVVTGRKPHKTVIFNIRGHNVQVTDRQSRGVHEMEPMPVSTKLVQKSMMELRYVLDFIALLHSQVE